MEEEDDDQGAILFFETGFHFVHRLVENKKKENKYYQVGHNK